MFSSRMSLGAHLLSCRGECSAPPALRRQLWLGNLKPTVGQAWGVLVFRNFHLVHFSMQWTTAPFVTFTWTFSAMHFLEPDHFGGCSQSVHSGVAPVCSGSSSLIHTMTTPTLSAVGKNTSIWPLSLVCNGGRALQYHTTKCNP